MSLHVWDDESLTRTVDGWVARAWCLCSFPFLGAAPAALEAERITWRRFYNHRGFAAAAGPGWNGVGL